MEKKELLLGFIFSVLLISFILSSTEFQANSNISSSDNWPMFRHDANHTGYSNNIVPITNPSKIWSYNTGVGFNTTPAIVNGSIYLTNEFHNNLFCLNASTGKKIWENTTGGSPLSPAVANGFVYTTYNGITAYNASTGNQLWNYQTEGNVGSNTVVFEDVVYVCTGKIYAVNATTGELIWASSELTHGSTVSSPAVGDGFVIVGGYDGGVYAFNVTNGELVWKYDTFRWVFSSPAIANGRVYIGSNNDHFYCLDVKTGNQI